MRKRLLQLNKNKLKKLGILAIYLFGSKAEKTEGVMSDIDIGVVFKETTLLDDTMPLYNAIYEELEKLFRPSFRKRLDIVFLQKAPITLQYNAITHGKLLYEAEPLKRIEYEERVIAQYLDFKPILEYFDRIMQARYVP